MFTTTTKKRVIAAVISFAMIVSCFAIIGTCKVDAAGKKSVYVISKINDLSEYGYDTKFTYKKNGMIDKEKDDYGTRIFKYNKSNRLVKKTLYRKVVKGAWQVITFKYKKGKVTKLISKGANTSSTYKYYFSYNKAGKLAKAKYDDSFYKSTTKYNYKKNKLVSIKYNNEPLEKISFNKKGDITTIGKMKISYTYKDGRVTKITKPGDWEENQTYKIKYKKIKVSKKMLKKVKVQQKSIVQYLGDTGFCIGVATNY